MIRKYLLNFSIALLLTAFSVSFINAQDESTASVYNSGLALLKAKNYQDGLVSMQKAYEMATEEGNEQIMSLASKNGAIAANNVGNKQRKVKAYDKAIEAYNKGIELNPEYSSNYEGVARCLESKKDLVNAVKFYIQAGERAIVEENDERAESRFKKAEVLVGKTYVSKDYDTAIEMARSYIVAKPGNADVNYYLSRALSEKGESEEALVFMDKAIELGGEEVDKFNFYKAELLEALGRNGEAAEAYKLVSDKKYKAQADYRISQINGSK
jgi:tetratricopeptide (TPR) repeat protein